MKKKFDLTDSIIRYEDGEMSNAEIIKFFQYLVDTGLAWKLQGSYGRGAMSLIEQGLVKPKKKLKEVV